MNYIKMFVATSVAFAFLSLSPASEAQAITATATWTDASDNEDGFRVEQVFPVATPRPVACSVGKDIKTCNWQVPDKARRCYVVIAFNTAGPSPDSAQACGGLPTAPGSFTIVTTTTTTMVPAAQPEPQP